MIEHRREKVRIKERVNFVLKHNNKVESSHSPKSRLVSPVNKPTSVGIDPVSSFETIKII